MLSYEEAKQVLGPVDDTIVADVIRTGASREELVEALAWIGSDDALMRAGRRQPSGTVASLVEILTADEEDVDEPGAAATGPLPN